MVEKTPNYVGYARVSTLDQDPKMQVAAIADYIRMKGGDPENIHEEHHTGRTMDRPKLRALIATMMPGSVLVVWKLDRLGRTLTGLIETVELLKKRGVGLVVTTQSIDTTTPAGVFFFHVFGALAEFESALISERTREGIKRRKEHGTWRGGSKPIIQSSPFMLAAFQELVDGGLYEAMTDKATWTYMTARAGKKDRKPTLRTYRKWKADGHPGAVLQREPSVDPDAE